MQQPKYITTIWWQPNLVNATGWRLNLVTMWLWQSKTFWSPPACGERKIFNRHSCVTTKRFLITMVVWQPKTFQLLQCFSPPPTPCFLSLLHSLPLMVIETLSVAILCDPFIKKWGYWWESIGNLNGICWEQMEK